MFRPTRRAPDWLLERLIADELPRERADELRAALREQGEEARLAELAASNARILAELPAEQVVREVERRARVPRRTPARGPALALSLAATCAAGLALFLLVRAPVARPPGGDTISDERPETIALKGEPLQIHRRTKTGSQLVRDGDGVRRGDTLQLGYQAGGKRFGVIASIDARGTVTLHLPESPGSAVALERNGVRALPHAFELDDAPGFERFVFARSDSPFTTADVVSALTSGRTPPAALDLFKITLTKEAR